MMQDKDYITDILMTEKLLASLYHYATQESSTEKLHYTFKEVLNDELSKECEIFKFMEKKGWYQLPAVDQQKINQAKTKFANYCK